MTTNPPKNDTPDKALVERLRDVNDWLSAHYDDEAEEHGCAIDDAIVALSQPQHGGLVEASFQHRVQPWMMECFGAEIAADVLERNDRFIEEALELVQANCYTADRAHALVDYVFRRPVGEPAQEVGGVMVTLAALCLAAGLDMHDAGEVELARISQPEIVKKIRAKQAAKPTGSALPIASNSPVVGEDAYCNKCGFFGVPQQGGAHFRPLDGEMCNYVAATPKPTPTDTADLMDTIAADHAAVQTDDVKRRPYSEFRAEVMDKVAADRREAVAKIVAGFGPIRADTTAGPATKATWEIALRKADAILSLIAGSPDGWQHVAYFDEGAFHWMSGIAPRDCELYARPNGERG